MANLNKKLLGTASGAIGDLVIRNRYGRTYIASKPGSYNMSNSVAAVFGRHKFTFSQYLFSALGKVYWFKDLWKKSQLPGDTFINKMFKENSKPLGKDLNLENIRLVPKEIDFHAELISCSIENRLLIVKISPLDSESGIKNFKLVSLQGVILLTSPVKKDDNPFLFLPFSSENLVVKPEDELNFSVSLTESKYFPLTQYSEFTMLMNLFLKDNDGVPVKVSGNICY